MFATTACPVQSVQFSCSVMSNSLWPHGLQHTRPPCPSPTSGVYSNSCPWSLWYPLSGTEQRGWSILCHSFIVLLLFVVQLLSSVQSLSCVQLFVTPWSAGGQASLFITNSWSLPKLLSVELVMPSNHLILYHRLLLPPSIFPSIRVLSNESVLHIRWPKYCSFSFKSVLP